MPPWNARNRGRACNNGKTPNPAVRVPAAPLGGNPVNPLSGVSQYSNRVRGSNSGSRFI